MRRAGIRNPVFVLDEIDRLDEAGAADARRRDGAARANAGRAEAASREAEARAG